MVVVVLRRLPFLIVATALVVAAFSTGAPFLFFLVYLGLAVLGGSYLVTRFGLSDLEAGYAVNQLHAHVGEVLRATYTLRSTSRVPKLWLEVHNPSTLPVPLPGRVISLGPHGERSWIAKVPLGRRGHFRVDPLQIRTGDPFGFFEASASVGHGLTLVVYPRLEPIPRWRLQAVSLEGSRSTPVRTQQTTPLATSVRPYAPGDGFNRIHWPSTARTGEIRVKEFDLEQTADVWIILDLQRAAQVGAGDAGTVEVGVRAAAAIAERAIEENRAVALTTTGSRVTVLPPDRGPRQRQKILQLLAAVDGDGSTPLVETLVAGLPLLRRGMSAIVVTSSTEPGWVRPLATLRPRGIGCQVIWLDPAVFARRAAETAGTIGEPAVVA
ncbi:MAG TPA: DUF58 domain-containing protein, partial [Candidatus Nanopelagicales bacterium]|nr:DUF58 domain-containing protein [Candidatus Nanopelagicales bacterium]